MWVIVGTSPQLQMGQLFYGSYTVKDWQLVLEDGQKLQIERGTDVLAAMTTLVCEYLGAPKPYLLCACDHGDGNGSKAVYAYLVENLRKINPNGITFHYLFPDVDWHNRILINIDELDNQPTLVADAGFMYVAKMSGYAHRYHLFTPDVGEMCFLADELAPHPFYTRGFLLKDDANIEGLLMRANEHGNTAQNLIVKGISDHVAIGEKIVYSINEPSVAAMEAIGGTGDMVTGLVSGLLAGGYTMQDACTMAVRTNRIIAQMANPNPATPVGTLLHYLKPALDFCMEDNKC